LIFGDLRKNHGMDEKNLELVIAKLQVSDFMDG
jgi:hypothetical protein